MQPPPTRGSGTQPGAFTFSGPLQEEDQVLEAVLAAMMRGVLPDGTWERLFEAAQRDNRGSELAFAIEAVSQGKRFKTAAPPVAAAFLLHGSEAFATMLGDLEGAVGYAERALAASPGSPVAFGRLEELLTKSRDARRLGEAYAAMAPHKPKAEQAPLLRQAIASLSSVEGTDDRVLELLQQVARLDAADEDTRRRLEVLYTKANRPRDVLRLYEQALAGDPPPDEPARAKLLARVIELYADALREPERALPFVEQLLALDPANELARAVAQRLVVVKGLAGRAAAALVQAFEVQGTAQDLARFLSIELESVRGPRRAVLLARLGRLRAERLRDDKGAFEAYDQALLTDPTDDELRGRYVVLAGKLGRWLEAAKTFARVVATAKDPMSRARATAQLGEVLLRSGEPRRARATLAPVLGSTDAPPDAQLAAARTLREILEADRDPRALADVLERLAILETNLETRREVDERLVDLAANAGDSPRMIAAYERLLETSARPRALAALAPLYEASGDPVKHARLLEEQSKDVEDPAAARELAMRAATIRAQQGADAQAAIAACRAVVDRFGPAHDVLGLLVPLLEAARSWPELAEAMAHQAGLATVGHERAALLGKLGLLRLQRLRDVPAAIEAFDEALAFDPGEKTARATLDKLTTAGDHRLDAARVLEPLYRREGAAAPLLKMLELRGALTQQPDERLGALREGLDLAQSGAAGAGRAFEIAGKALAEAVASGRPLDEWLAALDALGERESVDPRRRAAVLSGALGARPVTSDELAALARAAAAALGEAGDGAAAVALYERVLAHDPRSREVLAALDALLAAQGRGAERVALHMAALEGADGQRRSELRAHVAGVERDQLGDPAAAIVTCRAALEEDPGDAAARAMLADLYAQTGRWEELCAMLEAGLEHASGEDARALRARLAEVASSQGDEVRARRHGARLLEEAELSAEHLAAVERTAERLGDFGLARAVLLRRAESALTSAERIGWLERLGELDEERRGDLEGAATAWKTAGALALEEGDEAEARRLLARARRVAPDDHDLTRQLAGLVERAGLWSELPRLWGALVEQSADDEERVTLLLRTAQLLETQLGDARGAARQAARAFELAPGRADALEAFERASVAAGDLEPLERALDEAIARPGRGATDGARASLQLALARTLSRDPSRVEEAALAYRSLLGDGERSDEVRAPALTGMRALLSSSPPAPRRLDDQRWLHEWQTSRAPDAERVERLLEWATFEEHEARDFGRALGLYRRVLDLAPDSDVARGAVARLALATGDTEEALEALRGRRDRAEGDARAALDLEMARVLLERTTRWQEALEALQAVLSHAPDDGAALGLATQLVAHRATRAGAVAMLERASEATADPRVREQILVRLLDAPADADDAAARMGWFERLAALQRDEGDLAGSLATAVRAAREMPEVAAMWDRAEELARSLSRPDEVGALYEEVLGRARSRDAILGIGERAVQFFEEWYEDRGKAARVLERVLDLDPTADWAFDRLKLLLDSSERWDELFALYDRALERVEPRKAAGLLEEAVQTAKDFADRPDKAIGYLERLRALRPDDPKLASALERLYERQGKHRELVALLGARMPAWTGEDALRGRMRVAALWLDDLGDAPAALDVLEPVLTDAHEAPWALLERILAAAPVSADPPRSTRPPTSGGGRRSNRPKRTEPPPSIGRTVRQRAMELLHQHYAKVGRDADLARILALELESVRNAKERGKRHLELADLYDRIGDRVAALDHLGSAFVLDPADDTKRARLEELAAATGRFERLADLFAAAADASDDARRRVALSMAAATLRAERAGDPAGAIGLLWDVARGPSALPAEVLLAARQLIPLLEGARRDRELLEAQQRVAELDGDGAARRVALGAVARLAVELGDTETAIAAWQRTVEHDPLDAEALDGLVAAVAALGPSDRLVEALEHRARAAASSDRKRADQVAIAETFTQLGRGGDAIEAWRRIEREFGEADDAALALAALLQREERWGDLAELLARRTERTNDPAARAGLLCRLAEVQQSRLGDVDLSIASYERALEAAPSSVAAREGLLAVATEGPRRARAVETVVRALRAADDWPSIVALEDVRVAAAAGPDEQVAALTEIATLLETRGGDRAAAFAALHRALRIAPERASIAEALARLAESGDRWADFVTAGREASAALSGSDPAAIARLQSAVGEVLEQRLADPEAALEAHERAWQAGRAPASARTVVRLACQLRRWDHAAAAVVEQASVEATEVDAALDALEGATEGGWAEASSALERATRGASVAPAAGRAIARRRALWLRDRAGDPQGAQAAFAQALAHTPEDVGLLEALAELQRRDRGPALVRTLGALSARRGGSIELLREAADVALDPRGDRELAGSTLVELLSAVEGRGEGAPAEVVQSGAWAVERLAGLAEDREEWRAAADALARGERLPVTPAERAALRRRGARLALDRLGDLEAGIALYRKLLDEDPHDDEATARLGETYARLGRTRDLLTLREQGVATAVDPAARAALRLEAARLHVELENPAGAEATLRATLDEEPAHVPTVEALTAALESRGAWKDVRELLADQAARAEQAGDRRRAAAIGRRAAVVAEAHLREPRLAESHHQKAVALEPSLESLDALARLARARGDFSAAAGWLEAMAELAPPEELVQVTLRLADVLVQGGDPDGAAARLEGALAKQPPADALRERLAALYRAQRAWGPLAVLVAGSADQVEDPAGKLSRLLEAAELFAQRCGDPDRAVAVLERALALAPEDAHVRLELAGAMAAAGRHEPARAILHAMLAAFGARRPRERAPVHYQIARLELASGDRPKALAELDAATRIDPQNPDILRALATLAREDGQLDRAEKSYRALLAVLRRREGPPGPRAMARSEVLLELSAIAGEQGERDRALELLESAIEATLDGDLEQERLEAALRSRGDHETLVRVLEGKLARGGEPAASVATLSELGDVLSSKLARPEQALSARLRALMLDPRSPALHEAALGLARELRATDRYVSCASRLADEALAASDEALGAGLLVRLGDVAERDLRDDRRAAELFERALDHGAATPDVLTALDRIYERVGDAIRQARVLERRIEREGPEASGESRLRLAGLRLASEATLEAGVEALSALVDAATDLDRVESMLAATLARHPDRPALLDLYERVGRLPGHERALVDALRRRAEAPGADASILREAVDVACRAGQPALAEALLEAAIGEGGRDEPGLREWALVTLADLRARAGDLRRSLELKRTAATLAEPDVARRLDLDVARVAAEQLGDLALAAGSYERLLERDPADREAWEPLLATYRRGGDAAKLTALLARVVDYVDDVTERGRLRFERVRVMTESTALREADAVPLLREVLEDDPGQVEAAETLGRLLEQAGDTGALVELLGAQMDVAKDRSDAARVAAVALRLGGIVSATDRMEARNVYYTGLDWDPRSKPLLAALGALLEGQDDASAERAELLERQLAAESGPEAEAMAFRLADLRRELGDEEGAERALEVGFAASPGSAALRERLEEQLRSQGRWAKVAALCVVDARARARAAEKVARLREAAAIRLERLADPRGAADALAEARAAAPDDPSIGRDLVAALVQSGDTERAAAELAQAIDGASGAARAALLAERSRVRAAAGDTRSAVDDLEAAFEIERDAYAAPLADALDRARRAAESAGDGVEARELALRAARVLPYAGRTPDARATLLELLEDDAGDRAALRVLASLEGALGQWDAAVDALARLSMVEDEPQAVASAALALADACERTGRLPEAREALERAREAFPLDPALCARLEAVYELTGCWHELADIVLQRGRASGHDDDLFAALLSAGEVLMTRAGDAGAALPLLEEARAKRPTDLVALALMADALLLTGQAPDALALLEQAIAPVRARRIRELAPLQVRLARAARALGDATTEARALGQALECDAHSGEICAEVALRAMELEQLELANRALRAVTLLKTPGPMGKGLAYQYMGEIARRQGDPKRALVLLKRALVEDPTLDGARALVEMLER